MVERKRARPGVGASRTKEGLDQEMGQGGRRRVDFGPRNGSVRKMKGGFWSKQVFAEPQGSLLPFRFASCKTHAADNAEFDRVRHKCEHNGNMGKFL